MNIEERILRRQRTDHEPRLVQESDALNPIAHPTEPTGRGLVIEQLLDLLDPVFEGRPPADGYVWGPKGTGKSAVVRALFSHLGRLIGRSTGRIYTTTRAQPTADVAFVYVDGRQAKTGFALLHAVLNSLTADPVPKQGVSADTIRNRLNSRLDDGQSVVVAVDHVEEPETLSIRTVCEQFAPLGSSVATVFCGHPDPDDVDLDCLQRPKTVRFGPYRRHTLIEILTGRQTDGLLRAAISHEQLRELANWADGDAHDALAALFSAGLIADDEGHEGIESADLTAGMAAVPRPCVSLGRVLALPESRQRILSRLTELPDTDRNSVSAAADEIADGRVDLSRSTIERVLYELAEAGIIRRLKVDNAERVGRPPSRLEPRFPTLVFRHLSAVN
jgi:Cdc6-like AAA superfamily ATPase